MAFAVPHDTVLISDGGLATELEARGHDLSDALWSARLLVDAPQEIVAAHVAFFRAGAALATTASYQASFDGFAASGIGRAKAARLLRRSVELARTACAEVGGARWVAASIGPYGAALADAFAVAAGVPELVAVGVNCCAPADVENAVRVAREVTGKPVIVYPNSGEEWDGERRTWIGKSGWSAELAPRWAAAGARIIGGCCRVRPDDIAALAAAVG